jgi:fibronectin type 3 domain-containing protein
MRRRFLLSLLLLLGVLVVPPSHAAPPASDLNAMFNAYGDQGGHWTGADSTVSVQLPDGRVAWLFSDTFLGTVNPDHSRPKSAPFIHNSIVVQQGNQLVQTLHGGTAASPTSLVNATNPDEFYWIGAAKVQDGVLKALYGRYSKAGEGPLGFARVGTALVTFSLPALAVTSVTDLTLDKKVGWGSAIVSDVGYDYVYGTEDVDGYKFAHVARTSNLNSAWQFWNGTAWVAQETESARLLSGAGTAFSVVRNGNQFVLATHDGNTPFGPWLAAYTAPSPTGPFSGPTYVYKAPEPESSTNWQFPYDVQLHQEQASPGTLLLSYNNNSLNNEDNYSDARIYRPRFVDVPWPPATPDPSTVPAAPSGVAATTNSEGGGKVTWNAQNGLRYWVYQRDVTAGQTHFARSPNQDTAGEHGLGGLRDGHTYEFKVSATNANGEGAFSAAVSVTAHVTPPPAPANLRATAGSNADVALQWDAVTGNAQYQIYRRDVTANEADFTEVWFPSPSNTSFTVTDLVPGHTYEFKVLARNGGGQSGPSNVVQAVVRVAPPPVPTGLTAAAQSDGSVKLQWASAGDGLWYWVYQRDVTAGETDFKRLTYPVADGTTAQPGLLQNGHVYEFAVTSINRFNVESGRSAVVSVTARWDKPAAPTGLTAAAQGDGSVKLQWNSAGENLWYWVYQRDVTAGESFIKLEYPITEGTSFQPGLLLKDHVYEFKVSGINAGGEGPASAVVQATARYDAPAAPVGLTATPGDGTVALNWSAVPNAWYWIYQRDVTAGEENFTKLEYPITNGASFTAGLLANGHTYEFKVSAITNGGEGATSAVVSAKPMPPLPAKVTGLTATPKPSGEIELGWVALPSVYYWIYQRDVTAGQGFTKLPYPASEAKFTAGGLTHGHVYEFKIAATNLAGDGPASDVRSATANYALPAAPANLRGGAAGDGSIDLQWDSAGPNLYYWVYRRDVTAGETSFTRATYPTDQTTLSWEGLRDSHVYEFQVRAENAGGLGPASNTVSITSRGGLPAPPTNLTASPGNGRVVLNWTASPTGSVYYWVYYRDASIGEGFRKLDVPFGSPTATLEPLTNGHTYEFKVSATNSAGDSKTTPVVSARPLPPRPAAASLTAIAGNGEVGLGWNAVEHATYFWVEYRDTTAGQVGWQRLPLPVQAWAHTVKPLANGHRYEFRAISGNVAGESGASNVVAATPVPPPPAAPSNLRAVAGDKKVTLTWNASPSGPVYYWVYFRPQGHSQWYYFQYPASGTSFTATGLMNGFNYEFRVTAANLGGQSPPSNVVSAKPFQPLPSAPGGLSVTAGDGRASLSWGPSSGADYYWVYFQPQGQTTWFYFPNPVHGTSFNATGLLNGYNYSFYVRGANEAGQGNASNTVTVKPLPPLPVAPAWISASAERDTAKVNIQWGASPTAGVLYSLEYRNASDNGAWYPMSTTNRTSDYLHQRPVGVKWEFRVSMSNMAGKVYSPVASAVSNVWMPDFQYNWQNIGNGSNAAAYLMVQKFGLECATSNRQRVCFGFSPTVTGQPITIGDYFFFPQNKERLNRLITCEAEQKIDVRGRFGAGTAENYSHQLLKHEAVHTWQTTFFSSYGSFMSAYAIASAYSWKLTGNAWQANTFETQANLYWGGYLGPYGGTRDCY